MFLITPVKSNWVWTVLLLTQYTREAPTRHTVIRFCYLMTHSSPTIPEAASCRSSVKDTLFLSTAESELMEKGGGGVVALAEQ